MFNLLREIAIGLSAVVVLTTCDDRNAGETELLIERDNSRSGLSPDGAKIDESQHRELDPELLERGFVRRTFHMLPSVAKLIRTVPNSGAATADPFAEPLNRPETRLRVKPSLREIFENVGVLFPEGASVAYDETARRLVVVNTEEQINLIEAYLDSMMIDYEIRLYVRLEIYELTKDQAMQIIESTLREADHTPERNAVWKAVREGGAKLVSSPSIHTRSGQRSKVAVESSRRSSADEEEAKAGNPSNSVPTGTSLEVDAVVGADNSTLDLNFVLEHPLHQKSREGQNRGENRGADPSLGVVNLSTMTTVRDGGFVLVGSWDTADYSTQIAFVSASVQLLDEP